MRGLVLVAVVASAVVVPSRVASAEPPTETLEPRSFTLVASGDVLIEPAVTSKAARAAKGTGRRYDFAPLLAPAAGVVSAADLAICQMETPIGTPKQRPGGYGPTPLGTNRILAPYEIAAGLASAGFDRCSTASNHSYDLGNPGVDSTLVALDAAGVAHSGTARNEAEAGVQVFVVRGVKVAHLSYTNRWGTPRPRQKWRVQSGEVDKVVADVAAARAAGAEVIILSLHQGKELAKAPIALQREWATAVTARTQVELIVMHHPHSVQPIEQVNGTWVFWSLGNFVSGMGVKSRPKYKDPRTLDGLLAQATFTEIEAQPGHFRVEVGSTVVCTQVTTRRVYAASAALAGSTLDKTTRRQLEQCVARTRKIVPSAT